MKKIPFSLPLMRRSRADLAGRDPSDVALLDSLLPDDLDASIGDPQPAAASPAPAAIKRAAKRSRGAVRRRKIPWFGQLSFETQLKIWVPALLVSVLLGIVFLWVDERQSIDTARFARWVGDGLTHSQRMARSVPDVLGGQRDAFARLEQSRQLVDASLHQLAQADLPTGGGLAAPAPAAIRGAWAASDRAARTLVAQQNGLMALTGLRAELAERGPQLAEAVAALMALRTQAGGPARELAAVGELNGLTQRIIGDVRGLGLTDRVDPAGLQQALTRFRELSDALIDGSERLRLAPLTDAAARRALETMRNTGTAAAAALSAAATGIEALPAARSAAAQILADSEPTRVSLERLRERIEAGEGLSGWYKLLAAASGLIAVLALFGLFRAFLSNSEARAEEAERQRA
ncbi:MAG: hypothetical protein WCY32_16505, partial [Burkholderiaceae bacterium]